MPEKFPYEFLMLLMAQCSASTCQGADERLQRSYSCFFIKGKSLGFGNLLTNGLARLCNESKLNRLAKYF